MLFSTHASNVACWQNVMPFSSQDKALEHLLDSHMEWEDTKMYKISRYRLNEELVDEKVVITNMEHLSLLYYVGNKYFLDLVSRKLIEL